MSSKMRVYEIAKELNVESKAIIAKLQALGLDVRSHASSLDKEDAERFIDQFRAEHKASIVEKRVSRGVIRRRARKEPPQKAPREKAKPQQEEAGEAPAEPQEAPVTEPTPPEASPAEQVEETAPAEPQEAEEVQATEAAPKPPEKASSPKAKEAAEQAAAKAKEEQKEEEGPTMTRAKVIRRAPTPPAGESAKVVSRPPPSAKPSGIRVLKVVPGREGRGHEFIDMSKQGKGKRKTTQTRHQKADFREQLFDAFSPAYVPGRRRRLTRRGGRKTAVTTPKAIKRVIKMESDTIATSELARQMGVKMREVNKRLADMGEQVGDPRRDVDIDVATASMVAREFEYEVQDVSFKEEEIIGTKQVAPEELEPRPPVVTVMGHVDHGKTSILDAIRKTNVTEGEEGGITQHIGAYEVQLAEGSITFIDTPGHEAFTAMRARGASITDIVVLVVAADDGIMPQTIEAIHHAQEAGVPIVVAVNKIDLPGVTSERIRQSLTEYNLVPEEWGGDTMVVEVSAKTKQGLGDLLESILLQAEVLELKANPKGKAEGTVVEARLDRGRGPVATLLVKSGNLKKGDFVVVGTTHGKVRVMFDHEGKNVEKALPGQPVQVQGLNDVPAAGDLFYIVKNEKESKKLVSHRLEEERAAKSGQTARLNLEDFYEKLQGHEKLELKVLVKADVQGTAEAVKESLEKLSTPKVGVKVIHHGVGAINETDVNLASASQALVVGFNTRPDNNAKKVAQVAGIEIRTYKVIYDLTEDIQKAQRGLLPSTVKENVLGHAEVRELFNVPKVGTVAGVSVLDGKVQRGAMVRLLRDSVEMYKGRMSSLRRFKEDVREVSSGYECGIGLENYNDIKRGDIIEAFKLEEEQPQL